MKLQKAVFVLMGVMMLLFADKLSAQQVKTDYDRSASFGQYKTYSWEQVKTKDALETSVESKLPSMQPLQQKAGLRWIPVVMFPS